MPKGKKVTPYTCVNVRPLCVRVTLPLLPSPLQPQSGAKGKAKKVDTSFHIDCTVPVEDEIMEVAPFVSLCTPPRMDKKEVEMCVSVGTRHCTAIPQCIVSVLGLCHSLPMHLCTCAPYTWPSVMRSGRWLGFPSLTQLCPPPHCPHCRRSSSRAASR